MTLRGTERWLRTITGVALLAVACEDAPAGSGAQGGGESGAGGEASAEMDGSGPGEDPDGEPKAPQRVAHVALFDSFTPQALGGGVAGQGGAAPELPSGPPYGTSITCGDAIVGDSEECDDGAGGADACTALCETRDVPAGPAPTGMQSADRYLGAGRHPISGLDQGFITTYVEAGGDEPAIGATLFNIWGQPAHYVTVSEGASPIYEANPVAAALPDGGYAVAWSDFDGDGSDLGVALRRVEGDGELGRLLVANHLAEFSQLNPDMIWTGSQLVVAWEDYSDAANGPDLRYRTFDEDLNATSGDITLAATSLPEAAVALAPFNGGWAAAYREGAADGSETIVVKIGETSFRVGPIQGGPLDDRPALVELDETHLLLVFSAGTASGTSGIFNTPRLRYSIIDVETTGAPAVAPLDPLDLVFTAEDQTAQLSPAVERSGQGIYVAWRSASLVADAAGDQVWLKFLRWQAGDSPRLDAEQTELLIPRTCDGSLGDQRRPALGRTALPPGGALAIAWDDYGRNHSNGEPDVVAHYAPTHLQSVGETPRVVTETWSGATGSSWPSQWSSSITGPVLLTTQFKEGVFNANSEPGNSKMWINDHAAQNVDLLTTIRFNGYTQFGGMFARRADDDDDTYLWVSFSSRTPVPWRLNATIDGQAPATIDSHPLPMAFSNDGIGAKVDHQLRFRVMNNADGTLFVGMRTWRVGAVEPTAWLMEATLPTTSPIVQRLGGVTGRFGVLGNIESANGGLIFYDNFRATFFEGTGNGDLDASPDLPLLLPRAVASYRRCTPDAPCAQSQGCCSTGEDCGAGLACSAFHSRALGLGSHAAVCVTDHCANTKHDEGVETRADCGGQDCPACECASTVAKGTAGYCAPPCLCGIGDYPCFKNEGCLPGLICGEGAADPFGASFTDDACVPPHCMNRVLDTDEGETAPDYGGPCGSDPFVCGEPNGATGHCRVYCPCDLGEGNCRQDDECASGYVCAAGRWSRFGFPNAINICLPAHCTNNIKDTALGETAIDCGNACGCLGPCAGAPCPP